jgi:hypothetical protein
LALATKAALEAWSLSKPMAAKQKPLQLGLLADAQTRKKNYFLRVLAALDYFYAF